MRTQARPVKDAPRLLRWVETPGVDELALDWTAQRSVVSPAPQGEPPPLAGEPEDPPESHWWVGDGSGVWRCRACKKTETDRLIVQATQGSCRG